jgi:hypothetical protein
MSSKVNGINETTQKGPIIQPNIMENKFFIYGFFFLSNNQSGGSGFDNTPVKSSSLSDLSDRINNNNSAIATTTTTAAPNRLVFFIFNCAPDNIKHSLINLQTNTYLIRKSLFPIQKTSNLSSNNSNGNINTSNLTTSSSSSFTSVNGNEPNFSLHESYRFYASKNTTETISQQQQPQPQQQQTLKVPASSNRNRTQSNSVSSSTTVGNLSKKCPTISEILRNFLVSSYASDVYFLNYLDFIEEVCAKSYIKSIIHFLGSNTTKRVQIQRSLGTIKSAQILQTPFSPQPIITLPNDEDDIKVQNLIKQQQFEIQSINKLLKIGRKVKLHDMDLTEYMKTICKHIYTHKSTVQDDKTHKGKDQLASSILIKKNSQTIEDENEEDKSFTFKTDLSSSLIDSSFTKENLDSIKDSLPHPTFDWQKCNCSTDNTTQQKLKFEYLEQKFDEIFLKKFNLLPGFNDLFIFTPIQLQYANEQSSMNNSDNQNQQSDMNNSKNILSNLILDQLSTYDKEEDDDNKSCENKVHDPIDEYPVDVDVDQSNESDSSTIANYYDETGDCAVHNNENDKNNNTTNNSNQDDSDYLINSEDENFLDDYDNENENYSDRDSQNDDKNTDSDTNDDENNDTDNNNEDDDNNNAETADDENKKQKISPKIKKYQIQAKHSLLKTLKSSSPISNYVLNKKKRYNTVVGSYTSTTSSNHLLNADNTNNGTISNNNNNIKPMSPSGSSLRSLSLAACTMSEQIIGVELVCVIGTEKNIKKQRRIQAKRARQTTLTAENVNNIINYEMKDNIGSNDSLDIKQTKRPNFSIYTDNDDSNQLNAIKNTTLTDTIMNSQMQIDNLRQQTSDNQKIIFYSKFTKFNLACLLDLIEEKDMNEFKIIIDQLQTTLKAVNATMSSGQSEETLNDLIHKQQPLIIRDVKIYLRFNWYSFNEINSTGLFATNSVSSLKSRMNPNPTNQLSYPLLKATKQQQQPKQHEQNSNQLKKPPLFSSTATNYLFQNQQRFLNNHNFNTNRSLLSMFNTSSRLNNYLKFQQEFEYYNLLNPRIREFRWHIRDILFQIQTDRIKNMRHFNAYMMHIRIGVYRKYAHCHSIKRKVF